MTIRSVAAGLSLAAIMIGTVVTAALAQTASVQDAPVQTASVQDDSVQIGPARTDLAQAGPVPPQAPVTQTPLAPAPQYRPPSYSPSSPGGTPYFPAAPGGVPPSAPPGAPPIQSATPSPFGQSGAMPQAAQPGATAPSQPGTPTEVPGASAGPAIIPNTWLPQGTAVLQALDKVNAQSASLTVKVGQSARFGSLSIAVQACNVRPPDQPADAAAFLVVTDSHADAPGFRGWMLKKEPEVNMMEHPIYDLRVAGCTP